jgi:hypothetical protein
MVTKQVTKIIYGKRHSVPEAEKRISDDEAAGTIGRSRHM